MNTTGNAEISPEAEPLSHTGDLDDALDNMQIDDTPTKPRIVRVRPALPVTPPPNQSFSTGVPTEVDGSFESLPYEESEDSILKWQKGITPHPRQRMPGDIHTPTPSFYLDEETQDVKPIVMPSPKALQAEDTVLVDPNEDFTPSTCGGTVGDLSFTNELSHTNSLQLLSTLARHANENCAQALAFPNMHVEDGRRIAITHGFYYRIVAAKVEGTSYLVVGRDQKKVVALERAMLGMDKAPQTAMDVLYGAARTTGLVAAGAVAGVVLTVASLAY